jgi:hypothetical protein
MVKQSACVSEVISFKIPVFMRSLIGVHGTWLAKQFGKHGQERQGMYNHSVK